MELVVFLILAVLAVVSGAGVIAQRSATRSALFLLACFCCLAGLFILLNAQFVALAQVIVYAGAIVVLFLFVVLLIGIERVAEKPGPRKSERVAGILLGAMLLVGIVWAILATKGSTAAPLSRADNVREIGQLLLSGWAIPFEMAAVVLLVAIVGAAVLAKKRLEG
ncbi:MAG TPA: NADH-quinone oxidoreductase subunit J [Anaerolineae bacterium]|nr:NADH-quinone oxidoreductase subunit J [Anaerolineae bacterium]HNS52905.1 NADH-quinone oxidoreductase subunit J [Anaerolineae bacterium]